ncbi:MAG: hypothetical protein LBQ41_03070 [Candidatus Ancillula sp.]|jgi:hypothetical protein|nr:hypothetical protein [Candidatus Ancillula sp.]
MSNAKDEIGYLDFELPKDIAVHTGISETKSAALVTSINDIGVLAALCVVNEIEAVIMPSGVFGTVAFLHELKDGAPEKAVTKITLAVDGLDAVLVQYRFERMEAKLYTKGEFVEDLVPTVVVGNFSEVAEDALIGEIDLYDLMKTGSAKVDANHALRNLPSNFVPKKYQRGAERTSGNFNAFPTFAMPKDVALQTLKRFENV